MKLERTSEVKSIRVGRGAVPVTRPRYRYHCMVFMVALVCAPVLATDVAAQRGSILMLPEASGRLEVDKDATGALSASDYRLPNDAYVDVWEIEGRAGDHVTIDLRSDDFDAYLYGVGPGLPSTIQDDDSGGRCDARIELRFLEDGEYRVAATTLGSNTVGVYTIRASTRAEPAMPIPCGGVDPAALAAITVQAEIEVGTTIEASLGAGDEKLPDGESARAWEIRAEAGETLIIRLTSDDFDSYLYVIGPGLEGPLEDDDSGGDLHSEIVFTVPETGVYRIVASSLSAGGAGAFQLSVSQ